MIMQKNVCWTYKTYHAGILFTQKQNYSKCLRNVTPSTWLFKSNDLCLSLNVSDNYTLYCNIFVTYLFLKHPSLTSTYVFVTRLFGNNGPQQVNKSPPENLHGIRYSENAKNASSKTPTDNVDCFFHASTDVFCRVLCRVWWREELSTKTWC